MCPGLHQRQSQCQRLGASHACTHTTDYSTHRGIDHRTESGTGHATVKAQVVNAKSVRKEGMQARWPAVPHRVNPKTVGGSRVGVAPSGSMQLLLLYDLRDSECERAHLATTAEQCVPARVSDRCRPANLSRWGLQPARSWQTCINFARLIPESKKWGARRTRLRPHTVDNDARRFVKQCNSKAVRCENIIELDAPCIPIYTSLCTRRAKLAASSQDRQSWGWQRAPAGVRFLCNSGVTPQEYTMYPVSQRWDGAKLYCSQRRVQFSGIVRCESGDA
jgi:hypothetical protein